MIKHGKNIFTIIILLITTYAFYQNKVINDSYNWWGYQISPIMDSKYKFDDPKIRDIKLDKNTFEILTYVSNILDDNSTIFAFPSIPIFYWLFKKIPVVESPVIWFDVYKSKTISRTLQNLEKNNPDFIIWLKPSRFAYEGHINLKRSKVALTKIDDYIDSIIKNKKYEIIYVKPIISSNDDDGNFIFRKEILNSITEKFDCNNCNQMNIEDLIRKGEITNMEEIDKTNIKSLTFKNIYSLVNFIEKNKLTPINSNLTIFYVLKKIN